MLQLRTKRVVATVTSLVAVYALALNMLLSGLLLAGSSPSAMAGLMEICTPSAMLEQGPAQDGAPPPPHCPACLIIHAIDLPPPAGSGLVVRHAMRIGAVAAYVLRTDSHVDRAAHQPRAPPIFA